MVEMDKYTSLIRTALDTARDNDVYAIVRVQNLSYLATSVLNGNIDSKNSYFKNGMGITIFTKEGASGFASVEKLNEQKVKEGVELASRLAKKSLDFPNVNLNKEIFYVNPQHEDAIEVVDYKLDYLTSNEIEENVKDVNNYVRCLDDSLIVKNSFFYLDDYWRIARSDGTDVVYNSPLALLFNKITLKENGRVAEVHYSIPGSDYNVLLNEDCQDQFEKLTKQNVSLVSGLLNAPKLKSGNYKALLSHVFAGLFSHEAVGHAFETDALNKSIFSKDGKLIIGEKVAPENISFIDEPHLGGYGNQFISDNGIPRKSVEFIKNGIVNSALSDIYSAKDAGVEINGCGRSENFNYQPICRMSNTYIKDNNPLPFSKSFDDTTLEDLCDYLIENNQFHPGETIVYPVGSSGGQVSPKDGTFVFNSQAIYTLEYPCKISLHQKSLFSGDILGALKTKIKGIGPVYNVSPGMCGKAGQSASTKKGGNQYILLEKTPEIIFGGE